MLSKRMELVAPTSEEVTEASAPVVALNPQTIRCCVEQALRNYFSHLDGHPASDIYQMVLAEVEAPLLEVVRVAYASADKPVEWRKVICRNDVYSYTNRL